MGLFLTSADYENEGVLPVKFIFETTEGYSFEGVLSLPATPGAVNEGVFFGLHTGSITLSKIDLYGKYVMLDDIKFTRDPLPSPVPEPATLLLFGSGILSGVVLKKRRGC